MKRRLRPFMLAASLALPPASAWALDPWDTAGMVAPDPATPWRPAKPLSPVPVPARDAQPSAMGAYSLAQLTELALRNNPETRAAWAQAQAAAAAVGVTRADYLPDLELDGNYTRSRSATTQGVALPRQTRYGPALSLSYLLLDFGTRAARTEAAQASLAAANLDQNQAIQDVVLAVEQAYYQLLGLQALEGASQQSLRTAETNLNAAQQRLTAGLATVGDVYQVETTVAQAQLNLQQVQGQASAARGALATAAGLPVDTPLVLEPWPATAPTTEVAERVEQLIAQATAERSDLVAAQARVDAARAAEREAAASGRPTLSLTARDGRTYVVDVDRFTQSSLGFTLAVPLFNGFRTNYQVRQAEAQRAVAEASRDRLYYDVQRQVWEAYFNQRTAAATITSAQALQRSARQAAEVARGRYRAGVGTILEVLSTQTAEAQADVQAIQAQLNWYVGLAQLGHAVGRLGPASQVATGITP